MAREPARARLLWATLFQVFPVTFGHTTACGSPALAFFAATRYSIHNDTFHTLFRRPAPFPYVLGFNRPLIGGDTESSKAVQETPHPLFLSTPYAARPSTSSPNTNTRYALPQSHILHARHKFCGQVMPLAVNHLDAIVSRLHDRSEIRNRRSVLLIFRQPMQRVKKLLGAALARAPHDAGPIALSHVLLLFASRFEARGERSVGCIVTSESCCTVRCVCAGRHRRKCRRCG